MLVKVDFVFPLHPRFGNSPANCAFSDFSYFLVYDQNIVHLGHIGHREPNAQNYGHSGHFRAKKAQLMSKSAFFGEKLQTRRFRLSVGGSLGCQ